MITEPMMQSLRELGVTENTLSPEEMSRLDRDGYAVFQGVLSPRHSAQLAARLDALAIEEGDEAGKDFHTEKGATRLGSLVNKDPLFDICFTHPCVVAAVSHILGIDFGLSSLTGRAAQPGEGHQNFHRDNEHRCANALWVISDFTEENGPTRLVPGSHKSPHAPAEAMKDPGAAHPDEVSLIAPAGTLVVIDGWTWHSGTRNNSPHPRHLVSAFFTPRGLYQSFFPRYITAATRNRLSPAALFVLDHELE